MAYDPKRPRPASPADEPAPVDALLGDEASPAADAAVPEVPAAAAPEPVTAEDSAPVVEPEPVVEPASEPVVDLTEVVSSAAVLGAPVAGASSNGSGRAAPEVPVAPAPEEGTTNRAVLAAVLGGSALVALLLILWRRRRAESA